MQMSDWVSQGDIISVLADVIECNIFNYTCDASLFSIKVNLYNLFPYAHTFRHFLHWRYRKKSQNRNIRPKKKIGLFPVSRLTLFFSADSKLFFSTFKRKFKIREEKWRKNHQNPLNGSKVTNNCRNSFVTFAGSLFF